MIKPSFIRSILVVLAVLVLAGCGESGGGEGGAGGEGSEPRFCSAPMNIEATGVLDESAVAEPSGLVASRQQIGVYWTLGDSGGGPILFAIRADGTVMGRVTLTGASAVDWEDLAMGPGPATGDYLYVGDIGDNFNARADIAVLRLREPDTEALGDNFELTLAADEFDTLTLTYPDGTHNAETLMVHPDTAELFIVTKESDILSEEYLGPSGVYRAPGDLAGGSNAVLARVATVDFDAFPSTQYPVYEAEPGSRAAALPTAGDIASDGATIAVRTYGSLWMWPLADGEEVSQAMGMDPCEAPVALEPQGESFAFTADNIAYLTVDEQDNTIHEARP